MSKRIIYIGQEKADIVYYLSQILSVQGSVLAADNSFVGDLFSSVNKDESESVCEISNITYARNLDLLSDVSAFDYVLVYAGRNISDGSLYADSRATYLIMPDYTKPCLDMLKKLPINLSSDNVLIITRDICSRKISVKGLAVIAGVSPKRILGTISYSSTDHAAYVSLTHNGEQKVKGTSDNMQMALTFITAQLLDAGLKESKVLITRANKRK